MNIEIPMFQTIKDLTHSDNLAGPLTTTKAISKKEDSLRSCTL
ncbi:hypothetical protein YPPY15_4330 [Yersinia pestis PY-15]|nr:hypothetical protein YPPY15_4330 [Yersinia pestis PY-15]EIS53490.1 hypothetical protein YPPY64_4503 [Yersinia pestis PY-64]EIT41385.1 hypothetical protein YPPY101_4277 [Yersinia pestis PY-101]